MTYVESNVLFYNLLWYKILLNLSLSILGITCDALETLLCKNINDICYNDEDCCSLYCFKSFKWFNGACKPQTSELYSDSNPTGTCINF